MAAAAAAGLVCHVRLRPAIAVALAGAEEGQQQQQPANRLAAILRNKQRMLQARLAATGQEQELESRLQRLQDMPPPPHGLLQRIVSRSMEGRTAIVAEVGRISPAETPESLASRCRQYVTWGADALAVCTDEEISPNGIADLAAVCKAVDVPVLRKDWIIHPIQITDTREAGAAALTTIYSVLWKGTLPMLRYVAAVGLDAIVEVVNLKELEELSTLGIPLYGFNISVGISVSIPGFRQDIAKSLVQNIPSGAASIVGVNSKEEAVKMKLAGADAVYVKVLQGLTASEAKEKAAEAFLESLRDALSGDD